MAALEQLPLSHATVRPESGSTWQAVQGIRCATGGVFKRRACRGERWLVMVVYDVVGMRM